jgi:hypothetical protein
MRYWDRKLIVRAYLENEHENNHVYGVLISTF